MAAQKREINIDDVMNVLYLVMKEFGRLIDEIGKIEKDSKITYSELSELSKDPKFLSSIMASASPEKVGVFVKTILKFMELSPKINQMMNLPPEEKIQLGKKLEEITEGLKQFLRS